MTADITTLVITYNQSKFSNDLIDSLLEQDFEDQNIVISDDCSNDGTQDVYESRLPELKDKFRKVDLYLQDKNLGLAGRNNIQFISSKIETEYVQILEGDDYYYPDKTSDCVKALREGYGLVHGNFTLVQGEQQVSNGWKHWGFDRIPEDNMFQRLWGRNMVLTCTAAFNSELYRKCFDYELFTSLNILLGDYAGCLRMAKLTNFRYLPYDIAYYRVVPNSTMSTADPYPLVDKCGYNVREAILAGKM